MELSASTTPNFVPLPAPPELNYISAENAIAAMMSFSKEHGYGMSLKRSKPDGKDVVKTRYYYHCDRHGNYSPRGLIRERTSRSTGCMFQILIQKISDSQMWMLKVKNPTHNHGPMVPDKEKGSAKKKVKTWKVALIPGDGIGVEVTEAAVTTLQRLATSTKRFELVFESFDWGTEKYRTQGFYMPPDWVDRLKKFDAIFLGAIGSPGKSL
jgi:Isocitrate/isopropylmalate dehydrogenase